MTASTEVQERRKKVAKMAGKVPAKRIAAKLGCSVTAVHNDASILKVSLKTPEDSVKRMAHVSRQKRETLAKVEKIRKLAPNKTAAEIGEELNMRANTVSKLANSHGITLRKAAPGPAPAPVDRETLDRRIDAASRLLREQGWTVLRPDPFRKIDQQRRTQERVS